jgi:CRISPR-associated protein Cas1
MPFLYVTEQGSTMRCCGGRLVIAKKRETLLEVSCIKLDAILVFGAVQISTQAMAMLLREGIEVAFLTRQGKLKGQLTPAKPRNIDLRIAQYRGSENPAVALTLAQSIVRAKIQSGIAVLQRFLANHPEKRAAVAPALERLDERVALIGRTESLASLNGTEGSAAHEYFAAFGSMLLSDFTFTKRTRRPPTDPVNALLSFGYTLLANELHQLLDAVGFDPYLGFLHKVDYGRPSLALDLAEEFRHPLIDRFTLFLVNRRILSGGDFYRDGGSSGVYLTPDGMKTYLTQYERWMNSETIADGPARISFRACFRRQAQRLASALRGGDAYEPFRYPG